MLKAPFGCRRLRSVVGFVGISTKHRNTPGWQSAFLSPMTGIDGTTRFNDGRLRSTSAGNTVADPTRVTLLDKVRRSNEPAAWREFASIYEGMILSWLRRRDVDPHDAEDIRQDVMAAVHSEIGNFEHNGRPGAFRNWLRQITANRLKRFWRSLARRRKTEGSGTDLGALAEQLEDPDSGDSRRWDAEHNRYVLERLLKRVEQRFTPANVTAFRRITLDAEEPRTVATELGVSLGAVRVSQHRILRALREI